MEILYLVDLFIQISVVFGIGITFLANSSVSIRSVHFSEIVCGFKSYGPDYTKDRFWTHDQFANQATILDLYAIESRYGINLIGLCQ